jgi:hypothetical protein
VYLNDVKSGGSTCFKDLNLQIKPVKGKALLFFPSFADGSPDDRTMHAGQVAMDTKWIAQMYERANIAFGHNSEFVTPFMFHLRIVSIRVLFTPEIGGYMRGNMLLEHPQAPHTQLASLRCRIFSPEPCNIYRTL